MYCYNPSTKEILSVALDSPVSCVFLLEKKRKVIAASKNGFYEIDFDNLSKRFVFQIDIDSSVRYNDGIKDAAGRILIGTMGFPEVKTGAGKVYSYKDRNYRVIIENTTISNGMAFSPNDNYLYFIDTPTKKVAKYAYDTRTGEVEFDSNVIEFKDEGSPDGMCIDSQGMLWIAEWGGGVVSKWNPTNGHKLDERELPCINVSSCCLDRHSNLYVTTAKSENDNDIYGGGLFYIDLTKI